MEVPKGSPPISKETKQLRKQLADRATADIQNPLDRRVKKRDILSALKSTDNLDKPHPPIHPPQHTPLRRRVIAGIASLLGVGTLAGGVALTSKDTTPKAPMVVSTEQTTTTEALTIEQWLQQPHKVHLERTYPSAVAGGEPLTYIVRTGPSTSDTVIQLTEEEIEKAQVQIVQGEAYVGPNKTSPEQIEKSKEVALAWGLENTDHEHYWSSQFGKKMDVGMWGKVINPTNPNEPLGYMALTWLRPVDPPPLTPSPPPTATPK